MRLLLCVFPSRILVLNASPSRNVPGPSGGGFSDERYITITYTQVQGQQSGYQRPPVPPPSQFPVPPTYPTSGYGSASGHFDYYTRPPAVPQVQSRVLEHPAHPPPYHHIGFVTTGPPEISEPRPPYPPGPSGPPNQLPHAPERTRQQGYVRQPNYELLLNKNASPSPLNWPSTRTLFFYAYHRIKSLTRSFCSSTKSATATATTVRSGP